MVRTLGEQKHIPLWISINEICAHLTTAKVCDWSDNATFLCDDLLNNPTLREKPILFTLALSTAAQHMIHTTSNVYTFCKRARTNWGLTYRWKEWKAIFKEAETVENVKARNGALSAAVAMDKAERLYNHVPVKRERRMTTSGMLKHSKTSGDTDGQPQQKNVAKKRSQNTMRV